VANRILSLIVLAGVVMPMSAQSKPSIQGVWRVVEVAITFATQITEQQP